jgi:hypothetical protein
VTRRARLIIAIGLACAVAAAVLLVLRPWASGPVSTLLGGGQPVVEGEGSDVPKGLPMDATAWAFNSASSAVTFVSATLVPVTGRPAGRLLHAGLYLDHSYDVGNHSARWPPKGDDVRPLRGARASHGQAGIEFAMTGPSSPLGYTMAAGVRLTYSWQGSVYSVVAWVGAVACGARLTSARCTQLTNQAEDLAQQQAG